MARFSVLRTRDRSGARNDYLVCVSPATASRLGLRSHAVVSYSPPALKGQVLQAICRVQLDASLGDEEVRVDQTVRHALGIPYLSESDVCVRVEVHPLRLTLGQRVSDAVSFAVGRRYLFVRAVKCDVSDLEKGMCRLPCDAFSLLGCSPGDRIVIEAPVLTDDGYRLARACFQAYEATEEWLEKRRLREKPDLSARYPAVDCLLGVEPDVPHLYCDFHTREALSLALFAPALVRRDAGNLFQKRFVDFGLIFLLSVLATVQVLPINRNWWTVAVTLGVASVLSAGVVLGMLRSQVG